MLVVVDPGLHLCGGNFTKPPTLGREDRKEGGGGGGGGKEER